MGALLGIPVAVMLASRGLRLPMLVGGVGFWALAALLAMTMAERGYRPVSRAGGRPWHEMVATLREGIATVRTRPDLTSILLIMVVFGMSGEAVGRLAPLHMIADIGLPAVLTEPAWFGVLQAGSFLGAALITWLARHARAVHHSRLIVQMLAAMTAAMLLATLTFAVSSVFWLAMLAFWVARWVRIGAFPLVVARVNQALEPGVRATVLSMVGQAEAFGEACGGPALGLVATLRTVRAALLGAGIVLLPALPLFARVLAASKADEVGSVERA
jgi:MFS transporter, DHA3 family, tetracycline resistance protein